VVGQDMKKRALAYVDHLVSRRIEIDAAHRVPRHHSKCRNLHGHRYVVEAWCQGPLDDGTQDGMVIDFGFLKEEMVSIIDDPCDHSAIFSVDDPILDILLDDRRDVQHEVGLEGYAQRIAAFGKIYIIPGVPTAENLARHWFDRLEARVCVRTAGRAQLGLVKVWETPNCWASYGPLAAPAIRNEVPLVSAQESD
jgi:6-pyruvoyltetrahydropterin/6-carboxytetrahydropterin synthase